MGSVLSVMKKDRYCYIYVIGPFAMPQDRRNRSARMEEDDTLVVYANNN